MGKIIIHKELSIKGNNNWQYLGYIELKDETGTMWADMHNLGDTFRRKYSDITNMFINLMEPICSPHHLDYKALCKLREKIGATVFDKLFGYFPFDDITVFNDPESRNELVSEYCITRARVIAYEVK